MKKIILILLFSVSVFGGTYVTVAGYSYHFVREYNVKTRHVSNYQQEYTTHRKVKFNETHSPLGIYHDINNKYSISATKFLNSYYLDSRSIIAHRRFKQNKYLEFCLNAGIVDGYFKKNEWKPIAYPSVKFNYKLFQVDFSGNYDVVFVQFLLKVF